MFSSDSTQVSSAANYIEDVFSTYLYTGNGSTQTITNGIDLSTKGGLVWVKSRAGSVDDHILVDTARGTSSGLRSNTTTQATGSGGFTSFNTDGFSFGSSFAIRNDPSTTYVSWTFREQPKFFDVVTWTGDGADTRYIFHSLTGTTGCVIAKRTDSSGNWIVGHRSITSGGENLLLNSTSAKNSNYGTIHNLDAYSGTAFGVYNGFGSTDPANYLNVNGATYVAYVFAHNAGGFGLTGTDNVISCGSFTTDGSGNATANLGYEPQWVMMKSVSSASNWWVIDTMRNFTANTSSTSILLANTSDAEIPSNGWAVNSTGFNIANFGASRTFIYIAIRRGPMKVPTSGTSVFAPILNGAGSAFNVGFVPDMNLTLARNGTSQNMNGSRLVGNDNRLETNNTGAEQNYPDTFIWNGASNTFIQNIIGGTPINWMYKRAPSFFDEVCFTSSGSYTYSGNHNLTVVPELVILKPRDVGTWRVVGDPLLGNSTNYLALQADWPIYPASGSLYSATSTTISFTAYALGANTPYVAYLFATCAGVSKVGSYTGNGSTQTINCGFTGGARFVLIKRTDSTGGWYVYDTARGMTVLTDPYLLLNSTAAESATLGSVTTVSTGFAVDASILAAINTNAASYIFLAIA